MLASHVVFIIPYLGKLVLYKNLFGVTCFLYGIACFLYPAVAQLYDASTTVALFINLHIQVVYAVLTFYNAFAIFIGMMMMK